ncbi:MAG: glycosyltransferase family 39 protein [Gemmatimonadales bacterium]
MNLPASRSRIALLLTAALAGLPVFGLVLWASPGAPPGVYFDDGLYTILGRSLATGQGLRYLNLPGAPLALHYPPGYPALLALLWRIGHTLDAVAFWGGIMNALALAGTAALLALLLHRRFGMSRLLAASIAGAGVICTPVLATSTVLFSEPVFLVLLLATLMAAERAVDDDGIQWAALAGLLIGLVGNIRTIGVLVLPALVVVLIAHRRYRAALAGGTIGLLLLAPWLWWTSTHSAAGLGVLAASYGPYLTFYADALHSAGPPFALRVALHNARALTGVASALFAPWPAAWADLPTAGLTLLVLGVGAWRLRRTVPVTLLFLIAYLGVVLLWPYSPDRFLWGIWPLLIALIALIAVDAWRAVPETGVTRRLRVVVLVAVGLLALGYARTTGRGLLRRGWEASQLGPARQMAPVASWIRRQTGPGDIVAAPYEPLVFLTTGRPTVPVAGWKALDYVRGQDQSAANADLRSILLQYRPRYLVLQGAGPALAADVLLLLRPVPVAVIVAASLAGDQVVLRLDWGPGP